MMGMTHFFLSITAKKKPSVLVDDGVSVREHPSADQGLGASAPNFSSHTSPAESKLKLSFFSMKS